MNMFGLFRGTIYAIVMRRIKQLVKDAEAAYRQRCLEIDQECEQKKENAADELARSIIGR